MFTTEADVVEKSAYVFQRIICVYVIVEGVQCVCQGVLRGAGKQVRAPLVLRSCSGWADDCCTFQLCHEFPEHVCCIAFRCFLYFGLHLNTAALLCLAHLASFLCS